MKRDSYGVIELAVGKYAGVTMLPEWCSAWRMYRGSGHRFLQLGRIRFWLRWAY